jgi:hypothetical protein
VYPGLNNVLALPFDNPIFTYSSCYAHSPLGAVYYTFNHARFNQNTYFAYLPRAYSVLEYTSSSAVIGLIQKKYHVELWWGGGREGEVNPFDEWESFMSLDEYRDWFRDAYPSKSGAVDFEDQMMREYNEWYVTDYLSITYYLSWTNGLWTIDSSEKPEFYGVEFSDYVSVNNSISAEMSEFIGAKVYTKELIFPIDHLEGLHANEFQSPGGEEILPSNLPLADRDYTFSLKEQRERVD